MNMDETFANFKKSVESGKSKAKLDVVKQKAKYTSKDMAQIKDVLGTYTTEYGGSPYGRKVNVANGASKINGSMVYPGETLSVYNTVSPFTKENGYALAGSYENGQTVQTYGGGICQVSTTLYNAVIRAELKIVERFPHSMTVHYVPRSADAAIARIHLIHQFILKVKLMDQRSHSQYMERRKIQSVQLNFYLRQRISKKVQKVQ